MTIKKISIFVVIITSIGILTSSILYKKRVTNVSKDTEAKIINNPAIPSLLAEKLIIRYLLGALDSETEATLAPDEKPEKDPFHFHSEGDIFTWKLVGTLPNGDHIVYAYYWPDDAMGKFSGLYVVRYDQGQETLRFINEIAWGERHSSGICEEDCKLDGNQLTYARHMSSYQFFDYMLEIFPDLFELAEHKSREGLCYGESGYLGWGTFKVDIGPDGKLTNEQLLSFNAAVGGLGQEENTSLGSLSMINALHHVFASCAIKEGCSEVIQIEKKYLEQLVKEAIGYARNEDDIPEQDCEDRLADYQPTYPSKV